MFVVKPRLNDLMKERGLTQMKLSEMSGVPQSSISRFDRNTQHIDWHLFKIAKALEISVEDLFEIEE
ncbi:helix-turn-helix domain-containing protein [Priestia aryabhattai]|uniref:helix-turn-helix domain-containing protein n=1 Tax=Priestia aryabhattai TaxID=412384 RepID=UPI0018736BD7|nr:helix-turn-helix transcriptional regulator [Priestia aryabhattai]MBE5103306.1 helix-turn-helix transcriptional regulator [Priestia aryabhattai]